MPSSKSHTGSIVGAALGNYISPGIGTAIGAHLGNSISNYGYRSQKRANSILDSMHTGSNIVKNVLLSTAPNKGREGISDYIGLGHQTPRERASRFMHLAAMALGGLGLYAMRKPIIGNMKLAAGYTPSLFQRGLGFLTGKPDYQYAYDA